MINENTESSERTEPYVAFGELEDGGYVVQLEPEEMAVEVETDEYDREGRNLVEVIVKQKLGSDWLKTFSEEVVDRFDTDWESNEGHRERFARDWRLFTGELPVKEVPFKDCANINVPIMLENLSRVTFRAAGELFGDWSNVYSYVSSDPGTNEATESMTRHGNWQLRTGISDFKRQMHRATSLFFMAGDVTCHSYFDEVTRQNKHEILLPDEFVVPYNFVSTEPDYSDLPWYTRVLNWYPYQLEAKIGSWFGVEEVLEEAPPSWDENPESELLRTVNESAGVEEPEEGKSAPYKILHHEGWYKLPGQKRLRWLHAIVDYKTKAVLCLRVLERADWRDQTRYNHEKLELQEYMSAAQGHQSQVMQITQQHQGNIDQLSQLALSDPMRAQQMQEALPQLELPPEPQPPAWTMDGSTMPKPVRKSPVRMFAHGVLIEPLRGALGISYGRMQADFARAANLAFNQFSDQAHLSNIRSFIGSSDAEFDGPFEISPGKVNRLKNTTGVDLDKLVKAIDMGSANPQLVEVVKMVSEMAQNSMQAPSVLSGEAGKSGETYRGHASRVEQASKQLSVATSKLADFVTQILRNNAVLNSIFMEEEELFAISDKWGTGKLKLRREWYEQGYSIEIRSDLKYSSDTERVAQADELLALPQQIPQLQGNLSYIYAATVKALTVRGMHDMIRYLGPPPAVATTPLGLPPPAPPVDPNAAPPDPEGAKPEAPAGGPPAPPPLPSRGPANGAQPGR